MQIDSRLIGFTAHRESSPFSKLAWAICSIRRSPDPVKDRAHPSSRNSSSECLRPQELAVHLSMSSFTCPWVSFPLRDITRAQLRFFAEHPRLHFVPSSGFHNLSTVSSALELAGLFHPAATSRVRAVQGLLSPRSHPPSSGGACPLAVAAPSLTHPPSLSQRRARCHVRCRSASRLRSAQGRVPRVRLFTSPKAAPLFEFHAPPGFRSLDAGLRSHGCRPLMMLRVRCLRAP